MKIEQANQDVRQMISDAGVKHWMVASALNISKDTFCIWLRKPLSPDRRREVVNAIRSFEKGKR